MYKLLFYKLFNLQLDKTNQIISNHIFGKSFRFGKDDATKRLLVLRYFFSVIRKPIVKIKLLESKEIVFDISSGAKEIRIDYLTHFNGSKSYEFVNLDTYISFRTISLKIWFILVNSPLVLITFFVSLFFKDKSGFALLVQHKLIWQNLRFALENLNNCNIYYFSIYNNSSNYFAHKLINMGHKVIKIPSEVPISMWNSNILSSELVICSAYQIEEIEFHKSTIQIGNVLFWGPERAHEYIDIYVESKSDDAKNKIGFYSTAGWVRAKLGHMDQGLRMVESEKQVLLLLHKIVSENKKYQLEIFLHPKEKSMDKTDVNKYYSTLLGSDDFVINDIDLPSAHTFDRVDVAIAFHTTLMYERLYMGFKSIFFPLEMEQFGFPIKGSSIENICAISEKTLEKMILKAMKQSDDEFFESNDLKKYIKNNA